MASNSVVFPEKLGFEVFGAIKIIWGLKSLRRDATASAC